MAKIPKTRPKKDKGEKRVEENNPRNNNTTDSNNVNIPTLPML
jgi:hypothetical protein